MGALGAEREGWALTAGLREGTAWGGLWAGGTGRREGEADEVDGRGVGWREAMPAVLAAEGREGGGEGEDRAEVS